MSPPNGLPPSDAVELTELRERLREAEETLYAIRNGEVDAVVVQGPDGQQVYALHNADRPYRVLIEQMQEGAVTLTEDGTVLYCNQHFATLLAAQREALIGETVDRYIHSSELAAFRDMLTRRHAGGRSGEFTLCATTGADVPVNLSIADLVLEGSAPRVLCAVFTDLTRSRERSHEMAAANERLAIEIDERRRAEDSLQLALDAADMGNWVLEFETHAALRSPRVDQIFGFVDAGAAWNGEAVFACFMEEDRPAVLEAFEQAARVGTVQFEKRIRRQSDGAARWVQVKGKTYYRDGQAVRVAGVIYDVTERRQVEEQLRQAQKMEAIGQLTGGIAHDFNNLLMVVGGSLDMLDHRCGDDERTRRYLAAARHGVERGSQLNQQLLAFSRRQDLKVETICADDLISSFASLLERAVGEAVTVQLRRAPETWYCRTDPHQLETAILNLAINARDAMPQGGQLVIETDVRSLDAEAARAAGVAVGDYVVVSLIDTGVGMTPEVLDHVFEPFFTTKPLGKGTGLGLSQVYGFVRQSGGYVSVESEPGAGCRISIYLPRTDQAQVPRAQTMTSTEIKGRGTILVVEDDADVRAVASGLLEDLGYSVLQAESGRAAVHLLEHERAVDLVFTDVIMPGDLNGIDLVRELKQAHSTIPVLLTSGYTAQRIAPAELMDGLQLLRKPYSQVELSRAVVKAMYGRG